MPLVDDDDLEWYEERAAIREYMGKESRPLAEANAMTELRTMIAEREAQKRRERLGIPRPKT